MSQAKWVTPIRQYYLAQVFTEYQSKIQDFLETGKKSGWQVDLITGHFYHPELEARISKLIANWKQADREQRQAEWQAEFEFRHRTNDRLYPLHGKFSGIAKDVYYDNQPEYYLEGIGINALAFKPFAKIRLSSSNVTLYVDISDVLRPVNKNKKRKLIRYGKTPKAILDSIDIKCYKAVRHYLNS